MTQHAKHFRRTTIVAWLAAILVAVVWSCASCGGSECSGARSLDSFEAAEYVATQRCAANFIGPAAMRVSPPTIRREPSVLCEDIGQRRYQDDGCKGTCNGKPGFCAGASWDCGTVAMPENENAALRHEYLHHILRGATGDGDRHHIRSVWECQ